MKKKHYLVWSFAAALTMMTMNSCSEENSNPQKPDNSMGSVAPLADLVGVERQVAVVAFQLGDAFTNFIVPTSGVLLGALAAARLDWGKWARFQIKFQALLFVLASATVILGVLVGLS